MDFQLERDLVFLDIEATGLQVVKDRIVQIALIKFSPDGAQAERVRLLDPQRPIPPDAQAVHGISDADVRGQPRFEEVARELFDFIGGADLAGYNSNRYDIPLLMEEFARAGLEFSLEGRRLVDVQRIFYKMEPRTLQAALRYYCGKELEDAHDALADVRATVDVLRGQLRRYAGVDYVDADGQTTPEPVRNEVQALHDFTHDPRVLDATQRLRYDRRGQVVYNFGKYKGRPVEDIFRKDPSYYDWIMRGDFSVQVKSLLKKIKASYDRGQGS